RIRLTPRSALFPYTTLFRSVEVETIAGAALSLPGRGVAPLPLGEDSHQAAVHPCRHPSLQMAVQTPAAPQPRGGPQRERRQRRRSEEHTSELQSPYDLVCRL